MRELRSSSRKKPGKDASSDTKQPKDRSRKPKEKVAPIRKLLRPPRFTVADDDTLKKILSPPRKPVPEFQGKEYVHGMQPKDAMVYKCKEPNCNARFTNLTSLRCHYTKHLDRAVRCQFCGLTFKEPIELLKHNEEFHPDLNLNPHADPLKCKKCKKNCKDKKALWRHVRESHRNESYVCQHCNFQFTRPENLKDHLRSKHPPKGEEQNFVCKTCGKKYSQPNSLKTHIRETHRGRKTPLKCCICKTEYWTKMSYRGHMNRHIKPKYIPCITCNVTFRSMNHLRRHNKSQQHKEKVKNKGRNATKSINKDMQGRSKRKSNSLQTEFDKNLNLTRRTDQVVQLCNKKVLKIILHRVDQHVVTKSAAQKEQENYHKDLHLDCVYCDKSFRDLESVKTHERICYMKYRYPKLHICPICNKEFEKAFKLKLHSRVHFNERPYQCTYCDKTFKTPRNVVQHEKCTHFGIRYKPTVPRVYGCNYAECGRKYRTDKALHRHVASYHLGIRFNCKKCGRAFQRSDYLSKHLRIDHAECPTRLGCQPCKRTYKDRLTYLSHLKKPRHKRKVLEFEKGKKK